MITKGPWILDTEWMTVLATDRREIAAIRYSQFDRNTVYANAQAISALPELIQALQSALALQDHYGPGTIGYSKPVAEQARAALEKAGCL